MPRLRNAPIRLGLALLLAACGPELPPEPIASDAARGLGLTAAVPTAELAVPEDSRAGSLPPSKIPLDGVWRLASSRGGLAVYQTDLPIRLRSLFFFDPPPGLRVLDEQGEPVPHGRQGQESFTFDATHLRVQTREGEAPSGWSLEYPPAVVREGGLNYGFSGKTDVADFVFTAVQDGPTSRTGILLPAPGVIAWDLTVPMAGELRLDAGLVAAEVADGRSSDGARAVIEVVVDGETERVDRFRVGRNFVHHRVNLAQWEGQQVRLRLRTEPGGDSLADYVFFGSPALVSNESVPQRVVLLFIDTLRPDHLMYNGYERDTSPTISELARSSFVFDQARSVAPWTLPTARTVTTGRHPEVYDVATTLQSRFADRGWATGMFAGNVFLSSNFAMNRDWGTHRVTNWPPANEQVDRALRWLEEQDGRDSLLMLHFMDAHLPYVEPEGYRRRYVQDPPAGLGEAFHRGHVLRADRDAMTAGPEAQQALRTYIKGRYDSNIRFIDDEIKRLLSRLRPEDIVVLFSDHGEEFWDHGGFEHGHTLYDELLHVPLIIRANGLTGRISEPVSLLDLAPTVLDLAGIGADDLDGESLVPIMAGDVPARMALADRDQAIGRPLYGDVRWGVIHGTRKWTTVRDRQRLVDVVADPSETTNLLTAQPSLAEPFPSHLGQALGTVVPEVLRITVSGTNERPTEPVVVELTVPGGVETSWIAEDPTNRSRATVTSDGDQVTATWPAGFRETREVYVLPSDPLDVVASTLSGVASWGEVVDPLTNVWRATEPGLPPSSFLYGRVGRRQVTVTRSVVPLPFAQGVPLEATDPELLSALQEMGYAVGPAADPDNGPDSE